MSLKQLIINAIIKISVENPPINQEPKAAIASRDLFIQALMDELFPNTEQEVTITVPVVPTPAPVVPVEEKKKRAPMTEEAKAAAKAKRAANAEAKKAAPENPNLVKIDPTWRKHLKAADKEHAKELEPELLKYVNSLSNDDFHAKTTEAHVTDFVASRSDGKVEAELEIVEFNGKDYYVNPETKRVYEGEGVYDEATQSWTNYLPVGYVGMSTFTHMKL